MLPVRLLLVDSDPLFRRALLAVLATDASLQVVGQAGNVADAMRAAQELRPDLVLLDNRLPGTAAIEALMLLRAAAPGARIALLAQSEDQHDLHVALRSGASGYLLKTIEGEALVSAIHRIARGQPVISPELMAHVIAALRATDADVPPPVKMANPFRATLSPREQEVLREIARGFSNKEIARALDIAETTVKIHVQHILRKLGVTSRVQAAVAVTTGGVRT